MIKNFGSVGTWKQYKYTGKAGQAIVTLLDWVEFNVLWSPCLFFLFLSCFVFKNIFSLSLLVVVNSPHDWMNEGWLNSNTRRDRKKREHSPPVPVHKYSHDRVCVFYIFSGENEMGKNGHQIRSSGLGTFFIMSIFSLKSFLLHCRFFSLRKKSI